MQLYATGIDYYVSIQSEKFKYFKQKTLNLMMRPRVIEAMELAQIKKKKKYLMKKKEEDFTSPKKGSADEQLEWDNEANISKKIEKQLRFLNIKEQSGRKKMEIELRKQEFEINMNLNKLDKFGRLKQMVHMHQANCAAKDLMIQNNLQDQLQKLKARLSKRNIGKRSRVSSITDMTKEAFLHSLFVAELYDEGKSKRQVHYEKLDDAKSWQAGMKTGDSSKLTRSSSLELEKVENARDRYGKLKENLETGTGQSIQLLTASFLMGLND